MIKNILFISLALIMSIPNISFAQDNAGASEDSPWQFRLRGIYVSPDESATIEAIGGDVEISTAVVPELDITYFFTDNWSAELILGTTKHDVTAIGTSAGDIELGDIMLLPPTLTGQYHFTGASLVPYVGAGLNLTLFYGGDAGAVADAVEYSTAVGYAFQAGFDYMINDKWFINVDAKKLLLKTDVTVDATTALGATVGADVDINPWIIGLGIGMRL